MSYYKRFKEAEQKEHDNLSDKIDKKLDEQESIEDLIEKKQFEKAGDLLMELGRKEEALRCYKKLAVICFVTPGEHRYRKPQELAAKSGDKQFQDEVSRMIPEFMSTILEFDPEKRKAANEYCKKQFNEWWGEDICK
ncbi:hypothetical protein KY330_04015 [Candidatus Woesearchaeota archaeon]|nr:hypothetical protein [Candidatus Woesearchaeota archaeon]